MSIIDRFKYTTEWITKNKRLPTVNDIINDVPE